MLYTKDMMLFNFLNLIKYKYIQLNFRKKIWFFIRIIQFLNKRIFPMFFGKQTQLIKKIKFFHLLKIHFILILKYLLSYLQIQSYDLIKLPMRLFQKYFY
jgi:hypothetical protein